MDVSRIAGFGFTGAVAELDEDEHLDSRVGEPLNLRLLEQAHWQQAASVQDGHQPRIDPDNAELEELGDGIRIYRLYEVDGFMDGHPAVITRHVVKTLVGGEWQSELEIDCYKRPGGPTIAL